MSTIITGDPAAASDSLSATIIDATNASPIVVQTSAPHLFSTSDYVYNTGVVGNTGANGTFKIIVIDATHFSLTGSTGTGAYVSGGTSVDVALTPAFTIPSDSDDLDAASVNVALEALADRTQFLAKALREGATLKVAAFTAAGAFSWTPPRGCLAALAFLVGGGGGGGAGIGATTAVNQSSCGGGGGSGGMVAVMALQNLVPGVAVTGSVGTGGNGGVDGVSDAIPGNASSVTASGVTTRGYGGGGGSHMASVYATTSLGVALGGTPGSGVTPAPYIIASGTTFSGGTGHPIGIYSPIAPQCGGHGVDYGQKASVNWTTALAGGPSSLGFAGGNPGTLGSASGTSNGGGAGGGGGAAAATGGNGAGGGVGNNAGTGGNGGVGSAGSLGSGGGGGGAGGFGTGGGGTGGAGGKGGDGMVVILYVSFQ